MGRAGRYWCFLLLLLHAGSVLLELRLTAAQDGSTGGARIYDSCADAFADKNPRSREVTLEVKDGDRKSVKVSVFCMYNGDGTGFVFLARDAILNTKTQPLNLDLISKDRSQILIRVIYDNGRQMDTIIKELDLYRDHDLALLVNNYDGFANPKNVNSMGGEYLYVGILDKLTAARVNAKQGFVSNDQVVSFTNCDGKPNSYLVFYPQKRMPASGSEGSRLVGAWRGTALKVEEDRKVPVHSYAYMLEMHFGGCGAFETSSDWSGTRGAAFALAFTYDSCGDPGLVEGASRQLEGVHFTSHVRYSCLKGYVHRTGNLNRKCSPEDGWSGKPPVCERVRCHLGSQSLVGVRWTVAPPEGYEDSVLTSRCMPGYERVRGDLTRKCLHEEKWSGEQLVCTRVSCGPPEHAPFTNHTVTSHYFGDVITYTCLTGYVSGGVNMTRQCTRHGRWSGLTPACTRISCGDPGPVPHGGPRWRSFLYGDTVTYVCDPGYTTSDDVTLECLANSTWLGQRPTCQRISCVTPPVVTHALWTGETKYGDHIVFTCNHGYHVVSGTATLVCNKHGYWSGEPPVCDRVTCGDPGPVAHAHYSGRYQYEDEAVYVCDEGHVLVGGDAILVCGADGRWRGERIQCQEDKNPGNVQVFCPPAPHVANATWQAPDAYLTPVNTLVTYICDPDHEFKDASDRKSVVCMSTGRWSQDPGHCRLKRCQPLPEVRHGRVVRADPVIDSWHTASCHVGHVFPDGTRLRSVVCLRSKLWSTSLDDCRPIDCPPQPPANVIQQTQVNETNPEVEVYACSKGMRSDIGTEVQLTSCNSNGLWTRRVSNCSAENCFAPPMVENATLVKYGVHAGALAHFRCRRGSRFPSGLETHEISCLGRDWDETVVEPCSVTNCPVPRDIPDATLYGADYFYSGTVIRYECDYGFRFAPGAHQRALECLSSGVWSQDVGMCHRILCAHIGTLTGARTNTTHRSVDVLVDLECPEGQRFPLGDTRALATCLLSGNWTQLPGHCRGERCPPVPHVTHAEYSTLVADRGTMVMVMCLPGYRLPSSGDQSFNLTCGHLDDWEGTPENCTAVYCGDAPRLPLALTNQSGAYFGDMAVISCRPGYQFSDGVSDLDLHCQADSTWSLNLTDLSCQPLHCPPIPYVGNSTPSAINTVYDTTMTYTCLHGYWSPRDRAHSVSTRCNETGQWSPDVHNCLEIECSPVPVWLPIIPDALWRRFGVTINYTCPVNFTFTTGDPWRTANCSTSGEWTPAILPCLEIPDNTTIPPKEAEGSDTIGTFAVGLCGLVFGLVVLLDLLTIQKDLLILRRNLAACLPCLDPDTTRSRPREENVEMLPLMSTRSRMYTCENNVKEMKAFDHPDVKLFHGSSNIGLLSISSGDFESFHYQSESVSSARSFDPFLTASPVILKPLRLHRTFSIPFMEDASTDTHLSSISDSRHSGSHPAISCPLADDENWDDDDLGSTLSVEQVGVSVDAPRWTARTRLVCDALQQMYDPPGSGPRTVASPSGEGEGEGGSLEEEEEDENSPLVKERLQNGAATLSAASSGSPM